MMKIILLLSVLGVVASCSGQYKGIAGEKQEPITNTGDTVTFFGADTNCNFQSRCIFRDSKNNLWLAANGDGVYRSDENYVARYNTDHGLVSNFVWNIQEDANGNLWFKTRDGISRFDGKMFKTIAGNDWELSGNIANNWATDSGDIWIISDDKGGVLRCTGNSLARLQLPRAPFDSAAPERVAANSPYAIYCILKDNKGNVWFGTQNMGVCRYDGKEFTWFSAEGLCDAAVRCIYEDRNGIIWIGNNGYGLFRYDGKTLVNYTKEKKLHNPDMEKYPLGREDLLTRVWSINDDADGNLWIATINAGIWKHSGADMHQYTTKDGLGIDYVWTIYRDKNDNLLFGTDGAGVYTFDGKQFLKIKP